MGPNDMLGPGSLAIDARAWQLQDPTMSTCCNCQLVVVAARRADTHRPAAEAGDHYATGRLPQDASSLIAAGQASPSVL